MYIIILHSEAQTFNRNLKQNLFFSSVLLRRKQTNMFVYNCNQNRVREAASRTGRNKTNTNAFYDRVHGHGNSPEACVKQLQPGGDHFDYSAFNRLDLRASHLTEGTLN